MNRIMFFIWLATASIAGCTKQETVTPQVQLKSDTSSISGFLKSHGIEATKVNAGFWYSIDTLANGLFPVLSDSVTISYTASLIPSMSEVDNAASTAYSLSSVISGLQQGLILFPAGSYGRFYIPSGLAFGVSAHNKIPPNANLFYTIKFFSLKGTRFGNDTTAISSYLQTNSIVSKKDESGIRYTIDSSAQLSPPRKPNPADSIMVTYTEGIVNADTLVASVNSPVTIALNNQVTGWRIMLPKYLTEGSKIVMYTPSGYGYGSSIKTLPTGWTIPANSNLVYEVNLVRIIRH